MAQAKASVVKYRVELTETAIQHIDNYRRFERNVILERIRSALGGEPAREGRNRKLLRENPLADWELRVGRFRVFYDVAEAERVVSIVAVGHKERNTLLIGGEEFPL